MMYDKESPTRNQGHQRQRGKFWDSLKFNLLRSSSKLQWTLVVGLVCLGLYFEFFSKPTIEKISTPVKQVAEFDNNSEASTVIPAGFILVPLDIINLEAIKSSFQHSSRADVYSSKKEKIASDLELLQAPLNENQFGVLVEESLSPQRVGPLLQPVYITLRSPSRPSSDQTKNPTSVVNSQIEREHKISSHRVEYQEED